MRRILWTALAAFTAVLTLAACSSSTSGTGAKAAGATSLGSTAAGFPSATSPTSAATAPSSATAPATVVVTVTAPAPSSAPGSVSPPPPPARVDPGILTATWSGHGRTLVITGDANAHVTYRTYTFCATPPVQPCDAMSGNDIIAGGNVSVRLTSVVTANHMTTGTGYITASDDPAHPNGHSETFTLSGDVISSDFGTFCDPQGRAAGECGA